MSKSKRHDTEEHASPRLSATGTTSAQQCAALSSNVVRGSPYSLGTARLHMQSPKACRSSSKAYKVRAQHAVCPRLALLGFKAATMHTTCGRS